MANENNDEKRHEEERWEGPYYITLELVGGTAVECEALASFSSPENSYMALVPVKDNEDGTVYLYRMAEGEDDSVLLENIDDDREYQEAADLFEEMFAIEEEEET